MSLDAGSLVGGSMVGRWLAGLLLLAGGAAAAYLVLVAFYAVGWVMLRAVGGRARSEASAAWAAPPDGRPPAARREARSRLAEDVREGLRVAWATPAVRGVLIGSTIMNLLVFPYQQLLPVFVRDEWGQGPFVLGLLGGMDGLGALLASGAIATAAVAHGRGLLFLAGSLLVTACVLAVALAPSWLLAMPILLIAGLGRGSFASMQWTVTTSAVPGHLRGRAMGAISLAIGTVPLGAASLGVIAELLGAPAAVLITAGAGGLLVVALLLRSPGLRGA